MMEHADRENSYFQLIDSHGTFNDAGLERFLTASIPSETRTSYRVVSIMGPQSSGKSTLLNFLFGTNFPTMNGFVRRGLTTRGVWMAKCENIKPCTIVMDTEGSDGAQREGNTVFENQSTVFAVAISDVLIINMKNDDIGRNQAANRPLLRIVFKAMMKLYGENPPRKTTLMFIIRDRSVTADYILEQLIREDIEKLWHSFERPRAHQETSWNVYFDVEVVSLPTYIQERDGEQYAMDKTEQENRRLNERFKREVARLKQRFGESTDAPVDGLVEEIQGSIILLGSFLIACLFWIIKVARLKQRFNESTDAPAGGLIGERQNAPASGLVNVGETQNTTIHISGFALSTREMWRKIKEDKDLNQASHREMVAKARCKEIANMKICLFVEEWDNLIERTDYQGVGNKLTARLEKTLSDYDAEAVYFGEIARCERRKKLEAKLLQFVLAVFKSMVGRIQYATLDEFKQEFNNVTSEGRFSENANVQPARSFIKKFDSKCQDISIEGQIFTSAQTEARDELWNKIVQHIMSMPKYWLKDRLYRKLKDILDGFEDDAWPNIRKLVQSETESALSEFPIIGNFDVEPKDATRLRLESYAREVIEETMREEAGRVLVHLIKRFQQVFDAPKMWTWEKMLYGAKMAFSLFLSDDDEISKRGYHARIQCLKWLSTMAAIRLDDGDDEKDNISKTLEDVLKKPATLDCLKTSELWTGVPESKTLITPLRCHALYATFYEETKLLIDFQEEMRKEKKKRLVRAIDIVMIPIAAGGAVAVPGWGTTGLVISTTATVMFLECAAIRAKLTGEEMSLPEAVAAQLRRMGVSKDVLMSLVKLYSKMSGISQEKLTILEELIKPLLSRLVVA